MQIPSYDWNYLEKLSLECIACLFQLNYETKQQAPGEQRWVTKWWGDGQVTVHGDHTQRLYARRHAQHISRRPEFAHEVSKLPNSEEDVAGTKGHHYEAHDEVGNGQWGNEEVGDGLQPLEAKDGRDDQHVACCLDILVSKETQSHSNQSRNIPNSPKTMARTRRDIAMPRPTSCALLYSDVLSR